MQDWQISLFKFIGLFGSLLGVAVYWRFCSAGSLRRIFVITTVFAALAGCTQIVLATKSNYRLFGAV